MALVIQPIGDAGSHGDDIFQCSAQFNPYQVLAGVNAKRT